MRLRADLSRLIRRQFDHQGVAYSRSASVDRLAVCYLEMMLRRIQPAPRRVHFSDETHASLGRLAQESGDDPAGRAPWFAVFRLRQLLTEGRNVNGFLSRNVRHATGGRSRDGLLWHYGMHHFHLGTGYAADGFVQRSDYLLLAIVAPLDTYFIDVRRHPPPGGIEWVTQELLGIVHSNWPELIEAKTLHGVQGDQLSDVQVRELRRKNVNYTPHLGGAAIAPLLGGTTGDGSSVLCTLWARRLLADLQHHEDVLGSREGKRAIANAMRARGLKVEPPLEFELVFLDDLGPPAELASALSVPTCISNGLCGMGLAVVERTTRSPIVVHDASLDPFATTADRPAQPAPMAGAGPEPLAPRRSG